jgi:hypothetical protein
LEQAGKLENPFSSKTERKKKLFLNDLAERVYVPDKTSMKINGAEGQRPSAESTMMGADVKR